MENRIYTNQITEREGEKVTLAGWVDSRRDHGKLIFLDLRDKEGMAQLVVTPKEDNAYEAADSIREEWVVRVQGEVKKRPENMVNKDIKTGEYEINVEDLEVINEAETPPFPLDTDGYDIEEEKRLKYRYLDLRRPRLREMLRLRQEYKAGVSEFLRERGFTYVDTPILTKSTPEGARDFLVPSRHYPGEFYALPQSPQQYKQLLMIAGVEKYFQFARNFRDEDLRQDRLLEFEQLDIEVAFYSQEEILQLTEELVIFVSEEIIGKKIAEKPFPRLTYTEAMEKYGTDSPDLRKSSADNDPLAYVWITDFPMFEKLDDGSISSTHHPFTGINKSDINKLDSDNEEDILNIKAEQYDLVLNGSEVFGGSVRTHKPEILHKVFEVLGHTKEETLEKFGHLLEAFKYGVPPHGGIAASDRWLMAMMGEASIREVVPFPTTGAAKTSVMDAPDEVSTEQLRELGLKIVKDKNNNGHKKT